MTDPTDPLRRQLRSAEAPAPDARRQAVAREKALAAFRYAELHQEKAAPEAGGSLLFWRRLALGMAVLVAVQAIALGVWMSQPGEERVEINTALLEEIQEIFPGQQVVVIRKNGAMQLEVNESLGAPPEDQRILVELRKGSQVVEVYTYSGLTTCMELDGEEVCLLPLLQGNGEPLLMTRQAVLDAEGASLLDGYQVSLVRLKEGKS